jgi:hypothetical protein
MRPFLLFLFFLFFAAAHAQRVIDVGKTDVDPTRGFFYSVGGEPFSVAKYVKVVEGSPYFNENWTRGSVIMPGGRRYDSLQLKLDLLANELHFLNIAGQELVASSPVNEVILIDTVSGIQFRFVHSSVIAVSTPPDQGWYQLLFEGSVSLFVLLHKEISEYRPYNSATTEQTIKTTPRYFIVLNNSFTRIKKLSELADLLKDKSQEVKNYIDSNRLSGKSAADYISVLSYYNSLLPK